MPRWPAKEDTPSSAPSAQAECSSDLPSPPMASKPKDEPKTPNSRSPSAPGSVKGPPEDAEMNGDSTSATIEPDELMPPPNDDSASSSASSRGSHSRSTTPPPLTARNSSAAAKKKSSPPLQLIGDLPVARTDAGTTFNEIPENNYQNKSIGLSREAMEGMTCECIYRRGSSASSSLQAV
jgi:histone-lysine N-methyltransferase SETD2